MSRPASLSGPRVRCLGSVTNLYFNKTQGERAAAWPSCSTFWSSVGISPFAKTLPVLKFW
jgi:hypothetical protein